MQGIMNQMGIQMASRARRDLISGHALRLNPFGVIFRFQIAFTMTAIFNEPRRRFIVASSSAVLPEPGEDIKLITNTFWASK